MFLHLCTLLPAQPPQLQLASWRRGAGRGADSGVKWSVNDPRRDSQRRQGPDEGVCLQVQDLTCSHVLNELLEWQAGGLTAGRWKVQNLAETGGVTLLLGQRY